MPAPDAAPDPPYAKPAPRTVTVLMVDLRGYSTLAATRPSRDLIAILTPFFERMTASIQAHGGFVDKFLGDGVMALFGAPEAAPDHLERALACAVTMQESMGAMNAANAASRLPQIHAGIGINTGEAMVGTFGPPAHREYTAIGDQVNLAARIEAFSLRGQILLSEASFRVAEAAVEIGAVRRLLVKGRRQPVTLYELAALRSPVRREVPRVESRSSPRVAVDLPLHYYPVLDQRVVAGAQRGQILNLGYDGMLTQLPASSPLPAEIRFTVTPELATDQRSELHARSLHRQRAGDGYRAAFAFTTVNTPGHEAIRSYVDSLLWGL